MPLPSSKNKPSLVYAKKNGLVVKGTDPQNANPKSVNTSPVITPKSIEPIQLIPLSITPSITTTPPKVMVDPVIPPLKSIPSTMEPGSTSAIISKIP